MVICHAFYFLHFNFAPFFDLGEFPIIFLFFLSVFVVTKGFVFHDSRMILCILWVHALMLCAYFGSHRLGEKSG